MKSYLVALAGKRLSEVSEAFVVACWEGRIQVKRDTRRQVPHSRGTFLVDYQWLVKEQLRNEGVEMLPVVGHFVDLRVGTFVVVAVMGSVGYQQLLWAAVVGGIGDTLEDTHSRMDMAHTLNHTQLGEVQVLVWDRDPYSHRYRYWLEQLTGPKGQRIYIGQGAAMVLKDRLQMAGPLAGYHSAAAACLIRLQDA